MGLIKNTYNEIDTGRINNNVYIKILNTNIQKDKCAFTLGIFSSKQAADMKLKPIDIYTDIIDWNVSLGLDVWPTIYNYIKTLTTFDDCVDL